MHICLSVLFFSVCCEIVHILCTRDVRNRHLSLRHCRVISNACLITCLIYTSGLVYLGPWKCLYSLGFCLGVIFSLCINSTQSRSVSTQIIVEFSVDVALGRCSFGLVWNLPVLCFLCGCWWAGVSLCLSRQCVLAGLHKYYSYMDSRSGNTQ